MGIEEALEDQDGGDLVDHGAMFGAGAAGSVEMAVSFGGGEALVPQVNGESKGFAQRFGKGMGLGSLGTDVAGHIQGIAENDGGAAKFAEDAAQGFEILLDVFADQGQDGLGREAKLVGDSDANAAVAEVETEETGGHSLMVQGQLRAGQLRAGQRLSG